MKKGKPLGGLAGKALRPTLCLLSCEVAGGDRRIALPASAALELMRSFTLIHDDIEDASPERWGRATVWCWWGEPQAINTGDSLHALAQLALLRLKDRDVSPQKVIQTACLLDETCLNLCVGQYLDIHYEPRLDVGAMIT